jgi:hypothetical protein
LPHRFDGRIRRPHYSDQDDWDTGVDLAELPQDVQAGLVGQAQIEENDVWPNVGDTLKALGPCVGDIDPVSGGGEDVAHLVRKQAWVVINQEQVGHVTRASWQWEDRGKHNSSYEFITRWASSNMPWERVDD